MMHDSATFTVRVLLFSQSSTTSKLSLQTLSLHMYRPLQLVAHCGLVIPLNECLEYVRSTSDISHVMGLNLQIGLNLGAVL